MGRVVIVGYRPKTGKGIELLHLVESHVASLREEGLVTAREAQIMKSADGCIIEVFEWESPEAIQHAHNNAKVQELWAEIAKVCDYVPIAEIEESKSLFSEFASLN